MWPSKLPAPAEHPQTRPSTVDNVAASTDRVAVDGNDENTVIGALDRLGYIYYNSFDHDPDGGTTIRAIYRPTGELRTLHIEPSGTISAESGWKQ